MRPAPVSAEELAPNAAPNLSITKTGTQPNGPGKPGPTVFTLRFQNRGNAQANGVVMTETVGAGMVFEPSLSSVGWNCNTVGAVDECVKEILEPLPADPIGAQPVQTATFAVTPTVNIATERGHRNQRGGDWRRWHSTVPTRPRQQHRDSNRADWHTDHALGTQQATLVTDANSNSKYDADDVIAYTFTITNTGTRNANALRLVSDFATDLNVQVVAGSVTASKGTVSNTTTSAYALFGNVVPGESVVVSFR